MLFSFSCSLPQGDLFLSILYWIYDMVFSPVLIYVVLIVWLQLLGHLRQHPIYLICVVQCFLHNHYFSTPCPVKIFTDLWALKNLGI